MEKPIEPSPDFCFPPTARLRSTAEFKAVYDFKRSVSDAVLVVYGRPNGLDRTRIGLSVSKKMGNAVVRNRFKRLLREAFRLHRRELPMGLDLVLIPRKCEEPRFDGFVQSLKTLAWDVARRVAPNVPTASVG